MYSGGDPTEWINRAEKFFRISQIPDSLKVVIATANITLKAHDAYDMFHMDHANTWEGIVELFMEMEEFGTEKTSDFKAALTTIRQTGTVEEYKARFNQVAKRVSGFSKSAILHCWTKEGNWH